MNLSPRLQAVASMLNLEGIVADIGTDHAYLPIYLIKEMGCIWVIATEYTTPPYQTAQEQIKKAGVAGSIEVRQGDGLKVLKKGEVEEIVIAGLGGATIRKIITGQLPVARKVKNLVLQPMSAISELRQWLAANHFQITGEKLAREGDKFYQVMAVQTGKMELEDPFLLAAGPKLIAENDPLLPEFLDWLEAKWEKIEKQLVQHRPESDKLKQIQYKLNRLQEVKRCLKN